MNKPFLSVVIPSYNETANLKRGVLAQVDDYLQKQPYSWEVIVSDDGSPELESRKIAKEFCDSHKSFNYVQNEHMGKPFAVWSGIKNSQGEIALFTDMDQSTPLSEIEKLLPKFKEGFDVVIGSRGMERKNFPFFRRLASDVFREFRRTLLLHEIVDTQAGFKAFRGSVVKELFPLLKVIKDEEKKSKAVGWNPTSFDVELLVAAKRRSYKIGVVSINWEDRDVSTGKARGTKKFIRESIEMLQEIFRVKLNDLRGDYNSA